MDPDFARQIAEIGKAAGGAIGVSAIALKILGPTADYLGQGLKNWTERRHQNLTAIFESAERKLGPQIDEVGSVPPRVLKQVLDEGSFSEDALMQEYFGGVLASSRSSISRDDRGVALAQLVARMSTYSIRLHYIIYTVIQELYRIQEIHKGIRAQITDNQGYKMQVLIPFDSLSHAMDFTADEDVDSSLDHALFTLAREALIFERFVWSRYLDVLHSKTHTYTYGPSIEIPYSGLIVAPSPLGVELFLWAQGMGNLRMDYWLHSDLNLEREPLIEIPPGSIRVSDKL